jgi:hypothetical protein
MSNNAGSGPELPKIPEVPRKLTAAKAAGGGGGVAFVFWLLWLAANHFHWFGLSKSPELHLPLSPSYHFTVPSLPTPTWHLPSAFHSSPSATEGGAKS